MLNIKKFGLLNKKFVQLYNNFYKNFSLIPPTTINKLPSLNSQFLVTHKLPNAKKLFSCDPITGDNEKPFHIDKFAIFSLHDKSRIVNKQFFVSVNDRIMVEKLADDNKRVYDVGEKVEWNSVLLVGSRNMTMVGQPLVKAAKVCGVVEEQTELKKIMVFRRKRRKGYKKLKECMPKVTIIRITDIEFDFESLLEKCNKIK